mmetsp:Transcript_60800/g.135479  ORF Transcript_60800/g.135479 Transcript_60800/m.135479 type:complete len:725 (-) Transcript_60800:117-2291(-)
MEEHLDSGHPEKPKPNREFLAEQLRKQSTQMLIVHPVDLELTHSIKVKKPLSLTSGTELKLTHSVRGQHTITIHSDVLMEEDGTSVLAIHAGSVNAFQFGKKEMEPRAVSAYAELLLQVEQEVVGRSESEAAGRSDGGVPTSSVLSMMDASGATMLHGLLIANTDAAIEVVFRIFEELPQALLQAHGSTRDSGPLFVGENHMHILVTNARNEQACRFMRLVVSKFSTSKLSELLRGQPSGTFFGDEPMINFGGHALAWAAGMGHLPILEEAVRLGLTDWVNWPCEESGFLPMHVAAQASAQETISWLLHQFGDGQLDVQAGTLTPLMLAGRAGRQEAVQSILEINRTSLWKWGSLEQCTMRIKPELDSHASEKQLTLLELLVRYDSIRKTNEMLLDTFMCGTLFTFYREKWRLQARAWFYVSMALLCLYLLALTALTSPYMRRVLSVEALGSITLGSALLMVEEEVREVLLWMSGLSPEEMATAKGLPSMRFPSAASTAIALFLERGGILKYLTLAAAVTLSLLVLTADVPAERLELQDVRCMLAAAATTGWLMLFTQVFTQSKTYGVFNIIIEKILIHDVTKFMVVFAPILVGFGTAMHALHPASLAGEDSDRRWKDLIPATETLFMLSFADPAGLDMGDGTGPYYDATSFGDMHLSAIVFFACYICFMVMSSVLMVNLLIAIMSATYENTMIESVLEWRIRFARMVLRMEILTPMCFGVSLA